MFITEDFSIIRNSEDIAYDFNLTHDTIKRWIKKAIQRHPELKTSFSKATKNRKVVYEIDDAGYDYLCNIYKGVKPASSEYLFKEALFPFIDELGYTIEYQKTILSYRVDFYISELNMVIEHDEEYHRQVKVSQYDKTRETYIINATGCVFVRIPAQMETIRALGYISKIITLELLKSENKK